MSGPRISPVPALLFLALAAVCAGVLVHAHLDHKENAPQAATSGGCGCGCSGTKTPAPVLGTQPVRSPQAITVGEPSVSAQTATSGGLLDLAAL